MPVAQVCNPHYSGGRNQEDHSLKSAGANSSWDPILKNPSQKRTGGVSGSRCSPWVQTTVPKKQKT
jgi:hypothetical protein